MNNSSVIGKILGRDGYDVETHCLNLIDLGRSDRACGFPQNRFWSEYSTKGSGRVCRGPPNQDGNARRIEQCLMWLENEVPVTSSTNSVNIHVAVVRPDRAAKSRSSVKDA